MTRETGCNDRTDLHRRDGERLIFLPMPPFDLQKTADLERLFKTPREARDARWISAFYAAAPEASLKCGEQQLIRGPDGFPYLALYLPAENEPFTAFCISHVLNSCLEHGTGIVIAPDKSAPEWVFTYGNLWSLHSYNTFDATPQQPQSGEELKAGRRVLLAAPSEQFLPPFARHVLKAFLNNAGIASPRVMLVSDAQSTPSQSLAFSIYPENFESGDVFSDVMSRIKNWFLPPHYGLVVLPKDAGYESHFVPL